ncbi:hypothetical protein PQX77_009629, partial [Marasmius sp. AFHP31]
MRRAASQPVSVTNPRVVAAVIEEVQDIDAEYKRSSLSSGSSSPDSGADSPVDDRSRSPSPSPDPKGKGRACSETANAAAEASRTLKKPRASGVSPVSASDDNLPTSEEHMFWSAALTGPSVDFPHSFSCLIDSGAHINLIRLDVVQQLGLPVLKLPEPFIVGGFDSSPSSSTSYLDSFVRLKLSDPSGKWTS